MIPHWISGSDVAEKTGWNELSMLELFSDFLVTMDLEDRWIDYLNHKADEELNETIAE
jgi:hypothetical protein